VALAAADRLVRGLQDVVAESRALRLDLEAAEKQRAKEIEQQASQIKARAAESRRQRWALCIIGGLLAVVCLMAVQTNQSVASARQSADSSKRTLDLLLDCLDQVHGSCGRKSSARTAKIQRDLLNGQRYIAQCSRALPADQYPAGDPFNKAFDRCFAEKLAQAAPLPSVAPPSPTPTPSR
jgi:hypothetical protein